MITMENNKLQLSSKTEELSVIETVIDDVFETFSFNESYYGNILVATTEAVNNAMQHGNHFDPEKKVNIEFQMQDSTIKVKVKDQGNGFDYSNLPDPTDPDNIDKPHGRGIFLMKHLADKVVFEDSGRSVELFFKISAN